MASVRDKDLKDVILCSFSGGETSGYMLNWLLRNKSDHKLVFVFANTGEENEQTLEFVRDCGLYFNVDIVWLEYERLGFKVVDFESAYRSHDPNEVLNKWPNHPFRKYIEYFGIPNNQNLTCSREMKNYTIRRYMTSIGLKPRMYDIAIGIRADEIDRIGSLYYPLVYSDVTKKLVNAFWSSMPFRLNLKGWEGNCKTCWKKSFRKLGTIAKYYPERFAFFKQMELEFDQFVPKGITEGKRTVPVRFFREFKTVDQVMSFCSDPEFEEAKDDSLDNNYQVSMLHDGTELDVSDGCIESCEVFGEDE